MKTLRLLLLLAATAIVAGMAAGCSSCSRGERKATHFDSIHMVTRADTMRVLNTTQIFMETLRRGEVDSALALLCDHKGDSCVELTAERRKELRAQFRQFPVLEYEIVTSEFKVHEFATATYRYRFMDNPTSDPNYPCWLDITLQSRELNGRFRLVLHDKRLITRPHDTKQ